VKQDSKAIIKVENLTKFYKGTSVPALNNISFKIFEKDFFGFLGPNGAGKTTTISILTGITTFYSGNAFILENNIRTSANEIKTQIGVVPQDIALYPTLTIHENLVYFGKLYGLNKKTLKERISFFINKLDLQNKANCKINTLSGGMKRRVNLIAGILHNPKIIFLDEPTVGIDVYSKSVIIELLNELNNNGASIIYTSHQMEEAENLCNRITIINNGIIKVNGTISEILNQNNCKNLEELFLKQTSEIE